MYKGEVVNLYGYDIECIDKERAQKRKKKMNCTKENILWMLKNREQNILQLARYDKRLNKDYIKGYTDLIKEIEYVVSVVWDE